MKGLYVDLSVRPVDSDAATTVMGRARELGYKMLGVEIREGLDWGRVLRESKGSGLRVVPRVSVRARTRREVIARISGLEAPKGSIIAVEAEDLEAARFAGISKRVHILRIKPGNERFIDKSQARLFRDRGWGAVEISLRPLIEDPLSRALKYLAVSLRRVRHAGLDAILVSDAADPYELWHPATVMGLLRTLGAPSSDVIRWTSTVPERIASSAFY